VLSRLAGASVVARLAAIVLAFRMSRTLGVESNDTVDGICRCCTVLGHRRRDCLVIGRCQQKALADAAKAASGGAAARAATPRHTSLETPIRDAPQGTQVLRSARHRHHTISGTADLRCISGVKDEPCARAA
jgi:hypothetical protein